ncbi:maleylpyruvate isomerase N-terminal domain-containing protein [Paractinoplanes ferrugineus]|uniref:Maleylpyruvate isomerase n=1 Tax=Paractinoplanes ferrugineus TaxID=113564 RepID=A0A919MNP8_9ACTN|nr:maleylpyruvate isomerase N-terminal domain-containing protein [Actinoplanes ferrugineus]GIE14492.1 maleylpyruvate isomerase [Actinoplanes ferrugineus]
MHVDHARARDAFLGQLDAFVAAVEPLSDRQLLESSRCLGWTLGNVVVHVHLGLQEMLLGLVGSTDAEPDSDAAAYWRAPAPGEGDWLDGTRFVQLLGASYRRPSGAIRHLAPTVDGVRAATAALAPGAVRFQGQVLPTGDFLATWAVELAVHHLDLRRPGAAPDALRLTRQTVEALTGSAFPVSWTDETVALLGTGRVRPTEDQARFARELPVLG